MALHGMPLAASVSLPRAAADERSRRRRRRTTRARPPRQRRMLGPARDGPGPPRGAYWVARSRSPAAGRGRRRAWARGRGETPVRFIQKGPDEFPRFFAVFSAIFRLGFGSEAGEEGGWTAAIAGDGVPAAQRGGGGGGAQRERRGGGYLSKGVRAIRGADKFFLSLSLSLALGFWFVYLFGSRGWHRMVRN